MSVAADHILRHGQVHICSGSTQNDDSVTLSIVGNQGIASQNKSLFCTRITAGANTSANSVTLDADGIAGDLHVGAGVQVQTVLGVHFTIRNNQLPGHVVGLDQAVHGAVHGAAGNFAFRAPAQTEASAAKSAPAAKPAAVPGQYSAEKTAPAAKPSLAAEQSAQGVQTDFLNNRNADNYRTAQPSAQKSGRAALSESNEEDVFSSQKPAQSAPKPAPAGATGKSVHASLLKALRTTHKNAVLFTLCADLTCCQEGQKFVFYTENETVYRAITRQDNQRILADVLAEYGVTDFEVRLKKKDDGLARALGVLKSNFGGTDIDIK